MKNLKFTRLCKLAALLSVLIIISSSCKKDDEVTPDFVGTWVATESIPLATGFTAIKEVITFSEDSFIDLIQMPGESSDKWIDYVSMKGSIAVNGNLITATVTELGISSFNMVTGMPTGTITSYKAGSAEFETLLSQTEQSKTFKSEYSIEGDKLTLKTDNNNDGDYLDANETNVYTRQ